MESLRLLRKLQMDYFFTVGKSQVAIAFAHRMIVVILKMLLPCGNIIGNMLVRWGRMNHVGILNGEIQKEEKKTTTTLLNRFTSHISVPRHRLGIRSRKPVKRLEVITKITNKLTQNICRLKMKRNVTNLKTSKNKLC